MAEIIGVIASVITVAELALTSSKRLYETIEAFKNADNDVKDFGAEVDTVQKILETLDAVLKTTKDKLEKNPTSNSASDSLKQCLRDFEPTMNALQQLCDDANAKVLNDFKGHALDKVKHLFKEKAVQAYRYRLVSYKVTINIIIGLVSLITSNDDRQVMEDLEKNITVALSKITGQMEGLQITLQSILPTEGATPVPAVTEGSDKVLYALGQCLKVSQSAVDAAPPKVKYAIGRLEVSTDARQFVSLTEGKTGLVGSAIATERGRQWVTDKPFDKEFMLASLK